MMRFLIPDKTVWNVFGTLFGCTLVLVAGSVYLLNNTSFNTGVPEWIVAIVLYLPAGLASYIGLPTIQSAGFFAFPNTLGIIFDIFFFTFLFYLIGCAISVFRKRTSIN